MRRKATIRAIQLLEDLPAITLDRLVKQWEGALSHMPKIPEKLQFESSATDYLIRMIPLLAVLPAYTLRHLEGGLMRALLNGDLDCGREDRSYDSPGDRWQVAISWQEPEESLG